MKGLFLPLATAAAVLGFVCTARAQELGEPAAPAGTNRDASATLVVFNETDPDSVELARFYAEQRRIPKDQVIGLKCSMAEEISRDEYDRTIAGPLRRAFTANFWWKLREPDRLQGPVAANKIRFVALIRGVPLKIAQVASYSGDKPGAGGQIGAINGAAVDSELAVLGFHTALISGAVNNRYFRSFSNIADFAYPELMLVCRLDAPTPEIVRRMITDSIAAEHDGLVGLAYIDARGITNAGYAEGDKWLYDLASNARRRGTPVVLDSAEPLFPQGYPMTRAGLYFGWYADQVFGPFMRPDFRFERGAVAVHIHSFSAHSVRSPGHWVAPLISAGAAATLGNVYEPFLTLTPQLDIFYDRLRAGYTFAESAYMSQRVLSWMTTFVGDPLYRPFRGVLELDERPASGEWAEYRKGARLFAEKRAVGEAALRASGKKLRSGIILEGLGLLQLSVNDLKAALASFQQARQFYGNSEDGMRAGIHEIQQLRAQHRGEEALALLGKLIPVSPKSPTLDFLRTLDTELRANLPKKR